MKVDRLTSFDLTPASRLAARARAVRYRRWGAWLGAYCGVLVSVFMLLEIGTQTRQSALGEDRRGTSGQLTRLQEDLRMLQRQLQANQVALSSARVVHDQVDWSVLMNALAEQLGANVVLENCTLNAMNPAGRPGDPAATHVLLLTGHARQQSEVWAYATRLEKTGLFASVRLLNTADRPFMDARAVEFHMECRLNEKGTP